MMESPQAPAAPRPAAPAGLDPPVGAAVEAEKAPTLFQPLTMRRLTLHNRFVVSPMCQYSADDGHHTDWHFAHLSQFILRGAGLTIVEATAVTANGRITPHDSGLWKDSQMEPLRRIVAFAHSQGQKIGIQLAHAGRKASTVAPWVAAQMGRTNAVAGTDTGGWPDDVWAPSALQFADGFVTPRAMTPDDIQVLLDAFRDAAVRAVAAGFDVIEIHGAHGYLLSEFLSPLSNQRTDQYGGSFENRTRLLFEVLSAVRAVIPDGMPLWLRISATEWMEWAGGPSWDVAESIELAKRLPAAGVDLLDVSSGGNNAQQRIDISTYYQVDMAGRIRDALRAAGSTLLIGAVGFITEAEMAQSIVQERPPAPGAGDGGGPCGTIEVEQDEAGQKTQADVVLLARQLLREPEFPLRAAHELGVAVQWPNQYARAGWRKKHHH